MDTWSGVIPCPRVHARRSTLACRLLWYLTSSECSGFHTVSHMRHSEKAALVDRSSVVCTCGFAFGVRRGFCAGLRTAWGLFIRSRSISCGSVGLFSWSLAGSSQLYVSDLQSRNLREVLTFLQTGDGDGDDPGSVLPPSARLCLAFFLSLEKD